MQKGRQPSQAIVSVQESARAETSKFFVVLKKPWLHKEKTRPLLLLVTAFPGGCENQTLRSLRDELSPLAAQASTG